jgi:hypothetical protein
MPVLNIDGLKFDFPDTWQASKYDDWSFYRHQFVRQNDGIQGVDALALSTSNEAFLIEVKDYRHPETEKPSELPAAVAGKVLNTLAAMLPARLLANDPTERQLAAAILNCSALKVVLHLENPQHHRRVVDPADIRQKLRRLLRAVDPHLKVVSMDNMQTVAWTVT